MDAPPDGRASSVAASGHAYVFITAYVCCCAAAQNAQAAGNRRLQKQNCQAGGPSQTLGPLQRGLGSRRLGCKPSALPQRKAGLGSPAYGAALHPGNAHFVTLSAAKGPACAVVRERGAFGIARCFGLRPQDDQRDRRKSLFGTTEGSPFSGRPKEVPFRDDRRKSRGEVSNGRSQSGNASASRACPLTLALAPTTRLGARERTCVSEQPALDDPLRWGASRPGSSPGCRSFADMTGDHASGGSSAHEPVLVRTSAAGHCRGPSCSLIRSIAMSELHRITVNSEQLGGRPCIRGLRLRVRDVLELLATGASREEILADYP